ncbi:aspartyl-tRNA(Asn)/glutamyl-tRNA(Gln) amidotransferase subunit C [Arcanobacterium wilhelmae]|uniref:Aspartyl/glutamyl-tRNA(Asn/Gln) amidotransferase subunit C n=1 Tax=Arcanobacterium wilhelmae TaxID=1803177 RepID=A0ABT9NA75_9ACTO|nr:Asp-tRNA(Asn)/Glu-tRNA(Gln) amidotransferase subunit GatC [Arcanobacterium wilhelmae]MDP9800400.1 aspartyl-tRNA(Asn)/glutamyl-tRNA(Gln) amidotransferase subunit C [Arcanobacterium wilhelmae]WFN89829.1 Asp-tRNA(Asn)/Glu-tRNA(Gln) amidotransferase subunit GatC [Arcanobacterium wilhelmae]
MSTFSKEEVQRLADLARIALTEEEVERMAGEFSVIADAVATVAEVADSDVPATSHPIALTNVMREDVVGETLDRDEVLAMAPDAADGKFQVPQILGEE